MPAKSTKKKTKSSAKPKAPAPPPDPREPIAATPAAFKATLAEFEKLLAVIPAPAEPEPLDLVEAALHLAFSQGLPCGYGQEVRRRLEQTFVDRNEFRVTEAYEVTEMLSDLEVPGHEIPDLFERCLSVRDMISQVYADQNGITLAFLREAAISDRNMFFQRVPAMPDHVVGFLTHLLTFEEVCFSEKSTVRAQQRIGIDPKNNAANDFFANVRALLKPYGHLPLSVGKDGSNGKPNLTHELSPACLLVRLAPAPKIPKRRR
ncbi:MAG: hypothetical protein NXI31_27165 [bacterium]|nr:hypothetical protein [bacterium]